MKGSADYSTHTVIGYDSSRGLARILPLPEQAKDFVIGGHGLAVARDYTIDEAYATCEWINERGAGYPVPGRLAHLVRS